jgi:hypothetical protein
MKENMFHCGLILIMIAENHSHCLSWERRLQIAIDAAEGQYIFTFEEATSPCMCFWSIKIKNNWWSNCFDWYFFISWYSQSIWKNLLQSHYLVILSPHLILELTTAMDALDMFFSVFLGNYNKGRSFTLHWLFSSLIFY